MDFREVWMNSETLDQPRIETEVRVQSNSSLLCQNVTMALILLAFFLLLVNCIIIVFFNRKTISERIRSGFYRLSHTECESAAYQHVCEELRTPELKA